MLKLLNVRRFIQLPGTVLQLRLPALAEARCGDWELKTCESQVFHQVVHCFIS